MGNYVVKEKRCTRCGRVNHSVKHCYATTNIFGKNIETIGCGRCGHTTHTVASCYAKYDINGNKL